MRFLLSIYNPVLDAALRFRKTVIAAAALLLAIAAVLAFGLPRVAVNWMEARGWNAMARVTQGWAKNSCRH